MTVKAARVFVCRDSAPAAQLDVMKEQITAECQHTGTAFVFLDTSAELSDILEAVRQSKHDLPCIFVINEQSASKNAVLAVETSQYDDETNSYLHPTAADSRHFYLAPKEVAGLACNLYIANMDWEDWELSGTDEAFTGF